MKSNQTRSGSATGLLVLVVAGCLSLASRAYAVEEGGLCGRAGGFSRACDPGLRCDIRLRLPGVRLGLCVEDVRVCGGLTGASCPADQYCEFAPDAQCGAADQTGICRERPKVCTREYAPVCGCDGSTYGNGCMAAAAGVSVATQGECAKSACTVDADCPFGVCTSEANDEPSAARSCTVCGDGSKLTCTEEPAPCPSANWQVREIVNGCYGKCVERHACRPCCWYDEHLYEYGESFVNVNGCTDCTCSEPGVVVCGIQQCLCRFTDPLFTWISRDAQECFAEGFAIECEEGARPFKNWCGCGCMRRE